MGTLGRVSERGDAGKGVQDLPSVATLDRGLLAWGRWRGSLSVATLSRLPTTLERGDAERRDGLPPNVQQFQRWDVLHMSPLAKEQAKRRKKD